MCIVQHGNCTAADAGRNHSGESTPVTTHIQTNFRGRHKNVDRQSYNASAMSLGPGTKLGPYEILSAIGAGGMGEVYRARDSRLERHVAIKILPDAFATDRDRLARF